MQTSPGSSYGSANFMLAKGATSDSSLALVRFPLPTIPFDEQIATANLLLSTIDPGGAPVTFSASLNRVTDVWTETSTWADTATDFDPTVIASASGAGGVTFDFSVTSLVRSWQAGTVANNGVMVNASTNASMRMHSREASSSSLWPRLVITTTTIPVFTVAITSAVRSDPLNGAVNPKRLPGSVIAYRTTATNIGRGAAESNVLVLDVPVPSDMKLFVGDLGVTGSGPLKFEQGTPTSAVTYTYSGLASTTDDLSFSIDGSTFNYTPTADASGYDPAVVRVRVRPKGNFAGVAGSGNPNFTVEVQASAK